MNGHIKKAAAMRLILQETVGSHYPVHLRMTREIITGFFRGFADEKQNIILISEKEDSAGMYVVDVKQIHEIAAGPNYRNSFY